MANNLRNEAGTPWEIFNTLHKEYRFGVDICASGHNNKLPVFLSEKDNALKYDWSEMRVWCNPPYVDIPIWLAKAQEPELVAYLLPARTDRFWWAKHKPLAECHYFVGEKPHRRPEFIPPPGIKYSSNPMSMVLFLFGQGVTPGKEAWRSGKDGARLEI